MQFMKLILSYAYGLVIKVRHILYDNGVKKSILFDFPVIVIGNIEAGGTGKTPMVIKIANKLKQTFKPAILSRGYGRQGSDFRILGEEIRPDLNGDEPTLIKQELKETPVAVFADRIIGISLLLAEIEDIDCVILDDALQHRALIPGFSIMLVSYRFGIHPTAFLPFGTKRDSLDRIHKSNIVVVTKCPHIPSEEEQKKITQNLFIEGGPTIIYCRLSHGRPEPLFSSKFSFNPEHSTILLCGIANPQPLIEWLENEGVKSISKCIRKDHHLFREKDLHELEGIINMFADKPFQIITTEKDEVKLKLLMKDWAYRLHVFTVPVEHQFFNVEDENHFFKEIENYVRTNKQRS